jgi:hypothetical protein
VLGQCGRDRGPDFLLAGRRLRTGAIGQRDGERLLDNNAAPARDLPPRALPSIPFNRQQPSHNQIHPDHIS